MSESTADETEQPDDSSERSSTGRHSQRAADRRAGSTAGGPAKGTMRRYLYWGAFVLLALFGLFAAVSLYQSVMEIIEIWVSADFRPIFRMLFNLIVVLLAVLGLSVLIRRRGQFVEQS